MNVQAHSPQASTPYAPTRLRSQPTPQGMPHKWYQGKTGVVWNVTKRALGVEINKRVGAETCGAFAAACGGLYSLLVVFSAAVC